MAGYSKTKLIDKLGIKPGQTIFVKNAPENYFHLLGVLPEGVQIKSKLIKDLNYIHLFTKEKKQLQQYFPVLKDHLFKQGFFWISWPKGSSKVETDINENTVREIGLKEGLVDVKVCAIDEVWSGLKFMFRIKDRV